MLSRYVVVVSGGILCCAVLVSSTAQSDTLQDVLDILLQCQTAYYRLEDYQGTLRHAIEGGRARLRQETLEVVFRKPGFLSVRWQSGLYKGTTLLIRPDVNPGNVLIRLGEGFNYVTVNVPATEVGEPFVPGFKDLNEWLTALVLLAQRPITDRSLRLVEVRLPSPQDREGRFVLSVPAFLIPFRDNLVATYEFVIERGTGIPVELALRGAGGEVRQRMVYTSLRVNTGVHAQVFRDEEHSNIDSPVSRETNIDLRGFSQSWQRRYSEILDYSGVWGYETPKGDGEVNHSEISFKFRKPFDLYLHWKRDSGNTQEALFRRGQLREYPAVRIMTYWDVEERIPVKYESFDVIDCGDSCLVERHSFSRVRINDSMNDLDFDPGNAAYGFLLFRQAPQLDRFLTGRD